jgi:thiol-disulfide isomerase/thioredoxin
VQSENNDGTTVTRFTADPYSLRADVKTDYVLVENDRIVVTALGGGDTNHPANSPADRTDNAADDAPNTSHKTSAESHAANSNGAIPGAWLERDPANVKALADLLDAGSPPEIESETWLNSEEGPLSLGALKGKVVMLDFWATWCGPCLAAVPHTNELMEKHGDAGLVIIGICHPKGVDKMQQTAKDKGIKYPICADTSGAIGKAYAVNSYPDYYFIDRKGNLRIVDCKNDKIDEAIAMLLAEK